MSYYYAGCREFAGCFENLSRMSKVNYELGPDEKLKIIKQIFSMAAEGMGGKKIARTLNVQGIPAGRKWHPSTVLAILCNEAYLGHRVWNKKQETGGRNRPQSEWVVTENYHPAIISKDLWDIAHSQADKVP